MTEGGTYLCDWFYEGGTFRCRYRGDPFLESTGVDFETAADELASLIGERTGDGEAVLEFPSGRPGEGGPGVVSRWRALGYNESVKASNRSAAQYEGGLCDHCGFGIGARTEEPLSVASAPRGDVVGVDRTFPWALLLSKDFIDSLRSEERSCFDVRAVESPGPRKYFELVGRPAAGAVGVEGSEYAESFLRSWRCRSCGRRMMTQAHPDYASGAWGLDFVSASQLPASCRSVFLVDLGHRLTLAFSEDRWSELTRGAGTKGAVTDSLLAVTDRVAVPEPVLPDPDEFDW